MNIFEKMYDATKAFLTDVLSWVNSNKAKLMSISNKVTEEIALDILLSLQTKRVYIERTYGLNNRTIDSIFKKINNHIPFNFKKANRNVLYWNVELEGFVEKHFRG